jgi:hypothetical protein
VVERGVEQRIQVTGAASARCSGSGREAVLVVAGPRVGGRALDGSGCRGQHEVVAWCRCRLSGRGRGSRERARLQTRAIGGSRACLCVPKQASSLFPRRRRRRRCARGSAKSANEAIRYSVSRQQIREFRRSEVKCITEGVCWHWSDERTHGFSRLRAIRQSGVPRCS